MTPQQLKKIEDRLDRIEKLLAEKEIKSSSQSCNHEWRYEEGTGTSTFIMLKCSKCGKYKYESPDYMTN